MNNVITPSTFKQNNMINRVVAELVAAGVKFEARLTPGQRATWEAMKAEEDIDKWDASSLIGALLAIKDTVPKKARKSAKPGYYVMDDGRFLVVVENRAKTGTYAKVLQVTKARGKTKAKWEYAPGLGYEVADLKALTIEEATKFGHLHGVCLVCCKALTDPESVKRGIGPVCARRLGSVRAATKRAPKQQAVALQQPEPVEDEGPSINLAALERRKRRTR